MNGKVNVLRSNVKLIFYQISYGVLIQSGNGGQLLIGRYSLLYIPLCQRNVLLCELLLQLSGKALTSCDSSKAFTVYGISITNNLCTSL